MSLVSGSISYASVQLKRNLSSHNTTIRLTMFENQYSSGKKQKQTHGLRVYFILRDLLDQFYGASQLFLL